MPSELSSTISTSAALRACTPRPPPKITSCIDWPRTASGDCSPIAHSTASVTFDLPEPFGPDDDAHARAEVQPRAVGERLEALQRERLQAHGGRPVRMRSLASVSTASRAASCSACFLLLPAAAARARAPSTRATTAYVRSCGGPVLAGDLVADLRAAPREQLLQRRLEVDRMLQRLLDLRARTPRRPPPRCARSRRAGSRRRSPPRSPTPAPARSRPARPRSRARPPAPPRAAARAAPGARRPPGRRRRRPPARGSSSACPAPKRSASRRGYRCAVTASASTLSPRNARRV